MSVRIDDLDAWLKEFNAAATSNDRKRELQQRLHDFQVNCATSWQTCLQHLAQTTSAAHNQYLWLFCVSTVEVTITRNWTRLQLSDRLDVRNFLWQTYSGFGYGTSKLERTKVAQLIALIGKREFPNHHPGFVNEVVELMRRNLLYGLILMRAVSEEVVNTKEDLGVEQKKYFQSSLTLCLSEIFDVINKSMAIIVCKELKTDVTAIPQEYKDLRLLRALPDLSQPENDPQITRIVIELLECVQHLFVWSPLDGNLSEFMLNSLFLMAKWQTGRNLEIAAAALTALSELFYRQVAMPHPHLVANGIMQLLQDETRTALRSTPEMYQDKMTELLRLFTTQHSSKWIHDETFSNLLWHLFQFTFNSYGALAFTERLSIWVPIIKGLLANGGFKQYTDIMMALLNGILEKMQFQNDQNDYLEMLDNSILDDDMETEWQHFLTQCIEVIALLAEGHPEPVMQVIVDAWRVPFEVFFAIEKAIVGGDLQLTYMNAARPDQQSKCHYVHCILRDLSSLCQTFSRLAPVLEHCSDRISEVVLTVAISLVLSVRFLATKKPYHFHSTMFTEELQTDLVETFTQMLSALRGILPWSVNLKLESHISPLSDVIAQILIPSQHQAAHSPQSNGTAQSRVEPQLIRLASASLLQSITSTLRPRHLIEGSANIRMLMDFGLDLYEADKPSALMFYRAVCNNYVLAWHGVPQAEQHFDERAKKLEEFLLRNIGHKYLVQCQQSGAVLSTDQSAHRLPADFYPVQDATLAVLKDILNTFHDAASIAKNMLLPPMKQFIGASLQMFDRHANNSAITTPIFQFVFSCIQTLQIQLGNHYIKDILSCLLTATMASCASGHAGSGQAQGSSNSAHSIEKLLQILCLIVKNSNAAVQQVLLPSMLELTLDHIVPHLGQDSYWAHNTDIVNLIYTLFDGILLNHWQYFYKGSGGGGVLRKLKQGTNGGAGTHLTVVVVGGDAVASPAEEVLQHQDRFMAIMSLYGRALVAGNDPHVMDIVLRSLQRLNEHWKLYHKEVFQSQLLSSFQYALIGALISPEGALCHDLMMTTLYTMGQVNMKRLHESFYMIGFSVDNKSVQEICLTTDLPTFSYQMAQLIQDTRINGQQQGAADHGQSSPFHKT